MGEIRKENLHESLINELEELGNIDLSGKQDKTDESLLTESKDLVGAINELFQSANNGKELIASAIGEPLDSSDTFSAMSTDINGLLSTFKTNMMNNGVIVESSDKFKSLIDKIATMVEEGSGKGIQYAEGTINIPRDTSFYWDSPTVNLQYNLDFTPTVLFIFMPSINKYSVILSNMYDITPISNVSLRLTDISNTSVTITKSGSPTVTIYAGTLTYYAIGVGEEDTTLRDSLASILQEEGVSVTEEDDMANLISKVDEEFTNDNNTINDLNTNITLLNNQVTTLTTQVNNANSQVTTLTTQVNNANSEINTAKNSLATSLSNKGVSATASETLSSLTGKVSKLFSVSLVAGNSTTVLSYTSGNSSFSSTLETMLEIPVSTILNSKTCTTWKSFRVNADIYTTAASASKPKYLNVKVLLTNSAGTVKASSSEWSNLYTQSGEHHTTGSIDFSNAVAGDIVKIQSRCYYNNSSSRAYIKSVTITVDSVVK